MRRVEMALRRVLLPRFAAPALALALSLPFACRGSNGISRATMDEIRQAHKRWLTVDACVGPGVTGRVLSQMKEGGLDAAFFVISAPQGDPTPEGYERARATTLQALRRLRQSIEERSDLIELAGSPANAYRLEKEGRLAAYIGLANGYAIGTDVTLIAQYRREGVSCIGLCGDRDNLICDSALDRADPDDRGLSEFGRKVVSECNRLGIIIDLANCSEKTFFDVLKTSRAPAIVSHTAARTISGRLEDLSDRMIRALADRGGVAMISMEAERLLPKGRGAAARPGLSDMADHIDLVAGLSENEAVGIGSAFGRGGGVAGCRDPGEILNLTLELLRRGYSDHDLEEIWGGNLMRVFRQVRMLAGTD
jgi:membrane dipeptidase